MYAFTVTLALTETLAGFDFVEKVVYADHVYDAIAQATAFASNGQKIVMETVIMGRTTTWMTLDELELQLAA